MQARAWREKERLVCECRSVGFARYEIRLGRIAGSRSTSRGSRPDPWVAKLSSVGFRGLAVPAPSSLPAKPILQPVGHACTVPSATKLANT